MAAWTVPKIWENGTCFILGGGPSLLEQFDVPQDLIDRIKARKASPSEASEYMKSIHDKHIIAVNNTYLFGTWPDVLFFGDSSWYVHHRKAIKDWPGLKVSCAPRFKSDDKLGIKYVPKAGKRIGLTKKPNELSWNRNSGYTAINLALHFGVKKVFLLGFDMKPDGKGNTHFHGYHAEKPVNKKGRRDGGKVYKFFMETTKEVLKDANKFGLEIINCSPNSAITEFPKMTLKEALNAL